MNAQHNITQIARLLGRDKSTIIHELQRHATRQFYPVKQVWEAACKLPEPSRNGRGLLWLQ
jgi:IS30 family transposase